MLDVRYHIVYLCAVFLMLGFGILIGEHVSLPVQVTQTAKTLAALQVQVDGAVQEGREAKSQLVQVERSLNSLRPKLTHGKLTDRRVVVVQCGDYPQATAAAAAALQLAGANVAATVVIEDKMDALTSTQISTILQALPADARPASPEDSTAVDNGPILAEIAEILRNGATSKPALGQALQILQTQGLIDVDGDVAAPCTSFVFVGGRKIDWPDDGVTPIDGALIQRIQDLPAPATTAATTPESPAAAAPSVTIVGCEPFDVGISSIKTYQKYGLSTVDCIDRSLGQLDLPFTLRSDAGDRADYGLKSTATRQLPPVLEDQSS